MMPEKLTRKDVRVFDGEIELRSSGSVIGYVDRSLVVDAWEFRLAGIVRQQPWTGALRTHRAAVQALLDAVNEVDRPGNERSTRPSDRA